MPKFSTQHYNAIAKDIREEFAMLVADYHANTLPTAKVTFQLQIDALVKLALRLTKRFLEDNPPIEGKAYGFKPLKFLDACSPDPDLYPLSELWED